MGARTSGREAALQLLFGLETTTRALDPLGPLEPAEPEEIDRAFAAYWRELPGDPEGRDYAEAIVRGVLATLSRVDAAIRAASTNWRLERMTRVDRNVLRLGAWELLVRLEVPRAVILDEAVELAKRFGSDDSGSFVNGVLDRVAEDAGRKDEPSS